MVSKQNRDALIIGIAAVVIGGLILSFLTWLFARVAPLIPALTASPFPLIVVAASLYGLTAGRFARVKQNLEAKLDARTRERDAALAERDVARAEAEEWKEKANPTTLRQAARLLAKDIREFLDTLPDESKQMEPLQRAYFARFMGRYKKIKGRLEAELPNFSVKSWAAVFPTSVERINSIADDLDADARRVAEDALL